MATQLRGPVRPYLAVVESGSSDMAGLEQISLNVLGTEKAETFRLWQMVSTMFKLPLTSRDAGGNLACSNINIVRRLRNGSEAALSGRARRALNDFQSCCRLRRD